MPINFIQQARRIVIKLGPIMVEVSTQQLDLLSFLSNHSYLITVRIVRAQTSTRCASEAAKITRFVALLYRGGTQGSARSAGWCRR